MRRMIIDTDTASDDAVAIRRFGDAPGEITLVTLGPLTNIATALRIDPAWRSG